MEQQPVDTRPNRLARKILTAYFDEFVKKHYEKLMSRLQISEDDFREAIAEIRHLSPKPGNLYAEGGTDTTPYIIPDFILDYQDGRFQPLAEFLQRSRGAREPPLYGHDPRHGRRRRPCPREGQARRFSS